MHVAALSAGGQAPRRRFNGSVHSVFRQACNVRLDDGRLLALLAPRLCNVPHGVRLDLPAGFDFSRQVVVGQRVGCRADVLRVAGGELSIDLATAQPWRGELPAGGVDLASPEVARAWRTAWRKLQERCPRIASRDVEFAAWAVERQGVRLARAARDLQPDEAAGALDRLIGCGPGLTPSGDDLTIGFLAGLWSTRGDLPARRTFLDRLCAAVAAAATATGDISRAYLTHATHGQFAEPLTTLVRHISEGAAVADVNVATMAALRVGHTSGADGAFGMLLGLAAWAPHSALAELAGMSNVTAPSTWSGPGMTTGGPGLSPVLQTAPVSGQDWLDQATRSMLPRNDRPVTAIDAPIPMGRWMSDPRNGTLVEC
jgi:hypothetical protein